MSVIIETVPLPKMRPCAMELNIMATIQITAEEARRQVGVFAGNQIADLLSGETPALVIGETGSFWRVPVVLASRSLGRIGVVEAIDVNVETGELRVTADDVEEMHARALRFAAGTAL